MTAHALLVRNGLVVTPDQAIIADVAIDDGVITAVGPDLPGVARAEIDATGHHLLPGVIDPHVHFNEPGRTEWEGIASGSLALSVGGGTTFVDMPLNSDPPVLTGADVDAKRVAAEGTARVDFGLWGGLVAGGPGTLRDQAARGVLGFKGFMCDSGIAEFPAVDLHTLRDGMAIAAELGLPVLLHAEDDALTARLTRHAREQGRIHEVADYIATRPIEAEVTAITQAVELAAQTGCRLHIVHVSSAAGAQVVLDGQDRGVDVSCETCPQYLVLDSDDLVRLGPLAKAAPPPRPAEHAALWGMVADGRIPMITSDHSPSPPELKLGRPYLDCWGGISGCQSTLGLLLQHGHARRGLPLTRIATLLAAEAATRFRLPGKGQIAAGFDADLAIVDLRATHDLTQEQLHYRHRQSPYLGMAHRGRVRQTLLRGEVVAADGGSVGPARGRLLRPLLAATEPG